MFGTMKFTAIVAFLRTIYTEHLITGTSEAIFCFVACLAADPAVTSITRISVATTEFVATVASLQHAVIFITRYARFRTTQHARIASGETFATDEANGERTRE